MNLKQFFTILNFELSSYFKNKVFVSITLVLMIVAGGVLFYPRVSDAIKGDSSPSVEDPSDSSDKEKPIVMIQDSLSADPNSTLALLSAAMPDKQVKLTDKSVDELKSDIENDAINSAIVITSPTSYTYVVGNITMYDTTQYILDEVIQTKYRIDEMARLGITPEQASTVLNTPITGEVIKTGINQMNNFFYTYVLMFALYMAILLYGQLVATGVASEKGSRAMEMLITSAKPNNLMFGKVIGSGLAGLIQLVAIFGSSFVFFNINKSYWVGNDVVNSIFNMPLEMLLYTLLFFILGFFIYAFMFGAVGSLASKVEDVNTSSMPIMFIFIIAFMIIMFSMGSGNVDNILMRVCSFVPFTSPMAMFVRIAMGEVTPIEIIISVAILIITTIGIGILSAKIYRIGVLLYGTPPKMKNIIKALKN